MSKIIVNKESHVGDFKKRCFWAEGSLQMQQYHDQEWGLPLHNDRLLFEFLILEGAQAGLSWSTVLKKRADYQNAFDQFDPKIIAGYDQKKINDLLMNPGIIRNKLKIHSAVTNAKIFLEVQKEFGSFDAFMWRFVDNKVKQNKRLNFSEVPAKTDISDAMSKALKKRGFKFIGSTICYAFMQAVGMVNDHTTDCFRYEEVQKLS